jgi:hypothetical protein
MNQSSNPNRDPDGRLPLPMIGEGRRIKIVEYFPMCETSKPQYQESPCPNCHPFPLDVIGNKGRRSLYDMDVVVSYHGGEDAPLDVIAKGLIGIPRARNRIIDVADIEYRVVRLSDNDKRSGPTPRLENAVDAYLLARNGDDVRALRITGNRN